MKEFTRDVAVEYHRKALSLGTDVQDIGDRRKLRMELQRKYGLNELEAINALNYRNIKDIIQCAKKRNVERGGE